MRIIGGKFGGRRLTKAKHDVRPTAERLRGALFNIIGPRIEGMYVLELFAGTGAIGLEALSRGAESVTFVEKAPAALKKNIALLGCEAHARVIAKDAIKAIKILEGPFDLIFLDPPYAKGLGQAALEALDETPLLAGGGLLFIEESATLDVSFLKSLKLMKKRAYGDTRLLEFRHV